MWFGVEGHGKGGSISFFLMNSPFHFEIVPTNSLARPTQQQTFQAGTPKEEKSGLREMESMGMLKTPRDGAREKTCFTGEHREGKPVRKKAAAYSRHFACFLRDCADQVGLVAMPRGDYLDCIVEVGRSRKCT